MPENRLVIPDHFASALQLPGNTTLCPVPPVAVHLAAIILPNSVPMSPTVHINARFWVRLQKSAPLLYGTESSHTKFPFSYLAHVTLPTLAQVRHRICSQTKFQCASVCASTDGFYFLHVGPGLSGRSEITLGLAVSTSRHTLNQPPSSSRL